MDETGAYYTGRSKSERKTQYSILTHFWRRKWQPTPVFLPRESQGWGSLVGCRLWGHTELDTTEVTYQYQQHIYMEFRKMVTITMYVRQQKRHRCIEQSFGTQRERERVG